MTQQETETLIRNHMDKLRKYLIAITRDYDDADDAAAHAFIALHRAHERIDLNGAKNYLYTVAKHEAWEIMRRRRRNTSLNALPPHRHPLCGDAHEERSDVADLMGHLRSLNPNQQTAMFAKALGLSYKQTQEATGKSFTWVNRHTTEGRRALRAAMAA